MLTPQEIREKLRKLSITQQQLANATGVSQPAVSKLLHSKGQPLYDTVKKLSDYLLTSKPAETTTAEDIMNSPVRFARANEKVANAIKIMHNNGYSQLPIGSRRKVLGILTETAIVKAISDGKNVRMWRCSKLIEKPVIVGSETHYATVVKMVSHYPCILVRKNRRIEGIITKTDVI